MPELVELIEQLNQGAVDPVAALPALQAFYQHISETLQYVAAEPALAPLLGETKQVLQYAEEAINNTNKHVEKLQREQGGANPEGDSALQQELQREEMKLEMIKRKADLELQLKQARIDQEKAKFAQEQAMRDAENVIKIQQLQQ